MSSGPNALYIFIFFQSFIHLRLLKFSNKSSVGVIKRVVQLDCGFLFLFIEQLVEVFSPYVLSFFLSFTKSLSDSSLIYLTWLKFIFFFSQSLVMLRYYFHPHLYLTFIQFRVCLTSYFTHNSFYISSNFFVFLYISSLIWWCKYLLHSFFSLIVYLHPHSTIKCLSVHVYFLLLLQTPL
jgi:hypothetical protein